MQVFIYVLKLLQKLGTGDAGLVVTEICCRGYNIRKEGVVNVASQLRDVVRS